MNRSEIGMQRIQEILGADSQKIIESFKEISEDFARYVIDFAYGDLYTRKGITDKTRELAAVASLIGQGNTGLPLKAHLQGMLNTGWSKEEILEILIFLTGFVGFPSIVESIKMAKEVF